jgi:hypothetical protein
VDDLSQQSTWRARPLAGDPQPPFSSPLIFRANQAPVTAQATRREYSHAHRLGTAERGVPRILSLLS